MILKYFGHSCFKIESEAGSVVFDPYAAGSVPGIALPPIDADIVLSSHGHADHRSPGSVRLSGRTNNFKIESIESFHDEKRGALRGKNTIFVAGAEGLRLAHLGDLGCMLSKSQLKALGKPDLIMIPTGGFYTIDAITAKKICDAVSPRIIVPMHYREGKRGLENIAEAVDFLKLFPKAYLHIPNESFLDFNAETPPGVYLLRIPQSL